MLKRLFLLLAFVMVLATPLSAETLTNADIVKLVKAGLSVETIQAKIAGSGTRFDVSTDALVALANDGVPDALIKTMLAAPATAEAPKPVTATSAVATTPKPAATTTSAPAPKPVVRRYDVAIHRSEYAKCDGGELRVDRAGIKGSRCGKQLDFELPWSQITSVTPEYGVRGTIVIQTTDKVMHRISTTTPAEAKRIVETIVEVGGPRS